MKVLQINGVYPIKSTGRIVKEIADIQIKHGIEPYVATSECTLSANNVHIMGSKLYVKANILMTRLFGKHGFYNKLSTLRLLKWIDRVKPDVIHLHNIHGHYINVKLLFEYIHKHDIPVVWTLHDCWAFTGHCSHFDYIGCDKWKTGCKGYCPMQKSYPVSWFFNRSKSNHKAKKYVFTLPDRMHIVTPSDWLKGLCEESFLRKYPITTVHNGVETDVFKPVTSDLRKELGVEDKFVILGIVSEFGGYKGGEYFLKLSKLIKDDEVIVLLSLNENDGIIPANIIPLPRTADDKLLAAIYSMADVFVNPTLQDTFSMVNLESMACGTPVVTFCTGGATEALSDNSGIKVPKGNLEELYKAIGKVRQGLIDSEACRRRALDFTLPKIFETYVDIYKSVLDK